MFYDPADFPFVAAFERSWRRILGEYRGIRGHLIDWYERELYGEGWKVFGLYDFPRGRPVAQNVVRCPLTAALVHELIPRHGAAGFSVLRPRTRIRPHTGYQGDFLRAHLALDVPPGDLGLRVGGVTRRWRPGEMLVFDDRLEHAAWNNTNAERTVLIVDFIPEKPLRSRRSFPAIGEGTAGSARSRGRPPAS